ncbi:uncharacterized protein K452DRAFT_313082 [Aplosporella prunicola CBS 121167]|uniref:Uncharacterized protein n=1 Tax=Aplosporella prunicola CBS 121167 TaxID=1176127 RepID=A0A6A6AX91_9PEZI|nr:uncharacterized protein K452DRAFT_313082 [Aplosporella prunicola CBS 121167]KAF2136582.1 hypothetical protein K452DRAFT_313082 [Aplosporella prunicola CBS 121167]
MTTAAEAAAAAAATATTAAEKKSPIQTGRQACFVGALGGNKRPSNGRNTVQEANDTRARTHAKQASKQQTQTQTESQTQDPNYTTPSPFALFTRLLPIHPSVPSDHPSTHPYPYPYAPSPGKDTKEILPKKSSRIAEKKSLSPSHRRVAIAVVESKMSLS